MRVVDGTGARVLVHALIDQIHATTVVVTEEVRDATVFILPGGTQYWAQVEHVGMLQ